ncbi:peptidase S24/S26A/S26B/S26C [Lasiosphaeria miniovina]|uniref:Peptidase S24/S26A/S26B/S26C n=1 Tax=Lasiosphaeria miniovina TaxID=1954250 RepID=A0AA40B609_9PEZI|nr:peptidase S24/S26A/S26B/S26C [Lasiosphaeria miniovina]KAK0728278.1 peptidase S24/S26A/S26B/S26C [Lasiosphaeria miniovina]
MPPFRISAFGQPFRRFASTGAGSVGRQGGASAGGGGGGGREARDTIFLHRPLRLIIFTTKYLAFTHLFLEYGFWPSPASGPSMLPTFEVMGEWVLVSKWHRLGRGVSVGDVVAYNIPINDEVGVKRVIGLPGDYVLVNSPESASDAMIQVPQGHCWVIGDNLPASRDSRLFGPVPLALIRGKIIARAKPNWDFQWVRNPLRSPDQPSDA